MTNEPLPSRDHLMRLAGYPKPGEPGYIGTAYGVSIIYEESSSNVDERPVPEDPWLRWDAEYGYRSSKRQTFIQRDALDHLMTKVVLRLTDEWDEVNG